MGTKRKAEDGGENTTPKKVYKIFRSKNVIKNRNKRKLEIDDKFYKRKKPNSQVEMNSESNITLQDHLTNVIKKATMSNSNEQVPSTHEEAKNEHNVKVKPIKKTNNKLKKSL